ncbi:MAG: hypothetical protein DRJ63_04730 [Thermoprotei archaeon]|nr:MAG: hypothetical protein DRJ63_04730 [Thermoprotei archaeon]
MITSSIRYEYPLLKVPSSLIIDDWSVVCLNEQGEVEYKKMRKILLGLLDLGVRGKLSLVPCIVSPRGEILGYVNKGIKGLPDNELAETLRLVREKAVEYFDITPEILTHSFVVDIGSNRTLSEKEWEWSQSQDLETLTKYIAKALEILKDVGVVANGVTSPCDFGREVEGIYARAVLEAEKKIYGIKLTWYFLNVERCSRRVTPRLMYFDKEKREAVVSIPSCSRDYLARSENPLKSIDNWITEDGSKGRLVDVCRNKSYIVFHTHWWSIQDEESIRALKEAITRINRYFNVVWMKCSQIARYFAATKTTKYEVLESNQETRIILEPLFTCENFTLSFEVNKPIRKIEINGRTLIYSTELKPNTWTIMDQRIYLCFNLSKRTVIKVEY